MTKNKELNKCSECQFENGEHSQECSKYKEKPTKAEQLAIEIYYASSKKVKLSVDDWLKKIEVLLKAEKFALEKEYSWSYGILLRKELKEQRGEFIEILNGLEMKEKDKCPPLWKLAGNTSHNLVVREINDKLKRIIKKYE